jgi:hypothetical protein
MQQALQREGSRKRCRFDRCLLRLLDVGHPGDRGGAYLVFRRVPTTALCAAHCSRLRHLLFLSAVSAAAISVSVVGDGVLTTVRLAGREFSVDFLVPISSMVIEIVCASILIVSVRNIVVRMVHTAALLKT